MKGPVAFLEKVLLGWIDADRWFPIQLDINNACNLRCNHCYHPHHRNSGALRLADWTKIYDEYTAFCRRLRFRPSLILCGGEPLLSPDLFPIMAHARALTPGVPISILTNGTLITGALAERLSSLGGVELQMSLDGPTEETHDRVRGAGGFQKVRQAVEICKSQGLGLHFLAVLSRANADAIPRFFDLAREWGVRFMGFTRFIALGQGQGLRSSGADRPLTAPELKEAYERILSESARTGVQTHTGMPLMHLLHPTLGGSGRFWESMVVDYQGRLLASSRSRLVLGDVRAEGLENLFLKHPMLRRLRAGNVSVCGKCPHFRRCGGDRNAAYAEYGNFLGPDPGCWLTSEKPVQSKGAIHEFVESMA
ncbi:MAG TPA: radical SAM protein [Bdellovibrionota bacterium]|nr:radical SAM protein [Bdellovibrionota bacterium]